MQEKKKRKQWNKTANNKQQNGKNSYELKLFNNKLKATFKQNQIKTNIKDAVKTTQNQNKKQRTKLTKITKNSSINKII
jgi:hypothetical protein